MPKDKILRSYTIQELQKPNGEKYMKRENKGFHTIELLGWLEFTSKELVLQITQMPGLIPEKIERVVIMPKEEKESK
jgi:hypothetical protein